MNVEMGLLLSCRNAHNNMCDERVREELLCIALLWLSASMHKVLVQFMYNRELRGVRSRMKLDVKA